MAAKVDLAELRSLDIEDLEERIFDAKEELFNLRFQKSIGQLENVNQMKEVKRNIARMYTVLSEQRLARELLEQEG